jgi:hypothetical protein
MDESILEALGLGPPWLISVPSSPESSETEIESGEYIEPPEKKYKGPYSRRDLFFVKERARMRTLEMLREKYGYKKTPDAKRSCWSSDQLPPRMARSMALPAKNGPTLPHMVTRIVVFLSRLDVHVV